LHRLKSEISSYNKNLNKINRDKENWFRKKEEFYRNITRKIEEIKESKKKRDTLNKNVKELKESRNKSNNEITSDVSKHNELKNTLKDLTKKTKVKDSKIIKEQIEKIETKLETEAMPFEKEKDLSKKSKLLKRSLDSALEISDIINKIKELEFKINNNKKCRQKTHNEIQRLAAESQKLHQSIITTSKEIEDLKSKEKDAFNVFLNLKNNYKEKNNKRKEISKKIDMLKEKNRLFEETVIKKKEQEVEEKIKVGKKLTNDDFLVFQN